MMLKGRTSDLSYLCVPLSITIMLNLFNVTGKNRWEVIIDRDEDLKKGERVRLLKVI